MHLNQETLIIFALPSASSNEMKISLAFIASFVGCASAQSMSMSMSMTDGAVIEGVTPDYSSDDPFDGMTSEDGTGTVDGAVIEGVTPDYSSDDPFDGMTSEDAAASDDPYDGMTSQDAASTMSPAAGVTVSAVASAVALVGAAALF